VSHSRGSLQFAWTAPEASLSRTSWAFAGEREDFATALRFSPSLAYFASLMEEVIQPQVPESYWAHVRHKMEEMEKRWLQKRGSAPTTECRSRRTTIAGNNLSRNVDGATRTGCPTSAESCPTCPVIVPHFQRNPAPLRAEWGIGQKRDDGVNPTLVS
jgi:hypothetical protein